MLNKMKKMRIDFSITLYAKQLSLIRLTTSHLLDLVQPLTNIDLILPMINIILYGAINTRGNRYSQVY